jgi:hypothetical protein
VLVAHLESHIGKESTATLGAPPGASLPLLPPRAPLGRVIRQVLAGDLAKRRAGVARPHAVIIRPASAASRRLLHLARPLGSVLPCVGEPISMLVSGCQPASVQASPSAACCRFRATDGGSMGVYTPKASR